MLNESSLSLVPKWELGSTELILPINCGVTRSMTLPALNQWRTLSPGIHDGYDVSQSVSPFEYNLRSRRRIWRTFGLGLFVVMSHSLEYDRFVDCFSQVRNWPQRTKGLVRVRP